MAEFTVSSSDDYRNDYKATQTTVISMNDRIMLHFDEENYQFKLKYLDKDFVLPDTLVFCIPEMLAILNNMRNNRMIGPVTIEKKEEIAKLFVR